MNFRKRVLVGASIAAIVVGTPVLLAKMDVATVDKIAATVGLLSFGAPIQASFYGNPNLNVTAIDTSGGILMSRTSGNCVPPNSNGITSPGSPALVQVSASLITCTGTWANSSGLAISPASDLEFSWDFGDPAGTETFVSPASGKVYNANHDQIGNEATYAYRKAGTYTITLTVRGGNGAGGVAVSKTVTATFTVTDVSGTLAARYCDSANGNDSWNGTTPQFVSGTTGPKATVTGLMAVMANNSIGYLAQGSSWQDQGNIKLLGNQTAWRFSSYVGASGAGAAPLIQISGNATNGNPLIMGNGSNSYGGGSPLQDIVVSFINFTTNSVNGNSALAPCAINGTNSLSPSACMNDIYLDNCTSKQTSPQAASATFTGTSSGTSLTASGVTGTITVNSVIVGPGIPDNTFITAQQSGTVGGAGVYTTSSPTTCSGSAVTASTTVGASSSIQGSYCRIYTYLSGDVSRLGAWNCNFNYPESPLPVGEWGVTLGGGVAQWMFVVGGSITGAATSLSTLSHRVYSHNGSHALWRWVDTRPLNGSITATPGQNYALNFEQDSLPGVATLNTGTSQNGAIAGGGGPGVAATLTVVGEVIKPIRPIQTNMFIFGITGNLTGQVTAQQTTISSITYNGGTGIATLTTVSPHGATIGRFLWIAIGAASPSAYNGAVLATVTGASTMTFTPLSNPGGNASVPGTYTGSTFTITPNQNTSIPNMTGDNGFSFGFFSAIFQGTFNATTNTVSVVAGSIQGNFNIGDAINNVGGGGGNLNFGIINSTTGSPVSSVGITVPPGFTLLNQGTPTTMIAMSIQYPTIVRSILIDGCALATTQYGHSGNSSVNHPELVQFNDFVCQFCAFENLQAGGLVPSCLNVYTMRFCRVWGVNNMTNGFFAPGTSGPMLSTSNWRVYGNQGYFSATQLGEFLNNENQTPSGTMPLQFTDNVFWSDATNTSLAGVLAADNAGSLIDRNSWRSPNSASTPFKKASGSSIAFGGVGGWQSLGFDPNGSWSTSNALTGAFAKWANAAPAKWSDFGP